MTAIISIATSGTGLDNALELLTKFPRHSFSRYHGRRTLCHIRYFAAHDINSSALGEQKSVALPLFHSFIKQAIAGDRL